MPDEAKPKCDFSKFAHDLDGCVSVSDFMLGSQGCEIQHTVCMSFPVDASDPKPPKPGLKKKVKMEPNESNANDVVMLADASMTMPPVMGAATATTTATVAVQDNAIADIKALIPADGNLSGATVAMAVVGLAGSGAVLKIVKSFIDNRQEQEMKKLELEETKAESNEDEKHGTCSVERAALEAKVQAMSEQQQQMNEKIEELISALESAQKKSSRIQVREIAEEKPKKKLAAKTNKKK